MLPTEFPRNTKYHVVDREPRGSGSAWIRNFVLDPELLFRIQQKMNEQLKLKIKFYSNFRPVNSGLCVL